MSPLSKKTGLKAALGINFVKEKIYSLRTTQDIAKGVFGPAKTRKNLDFLTSSQLLHLILRCYSNSSEQNWTPFLCHFSKLVSIVLLEVFVEQVLDCVTVFLCYEKASKINFCSYRMAPQPVLMHSRHCKPHMQDMWELTPATVNFAPIGK